MARKWWTLIAVSVATFMLLLDITVVNVALPSIRKGLGASFTDLQWVVDAYALTLAVRARAGARARQRRGLEQHADHVAVRRCRGAARGVHRDRAPGRRADAPPGPVQAAGVHRGAACRVRYLGLGLRAVPLHHALSAELPRLLAARGGAALPAAHRC